LRIRAARISWLLMRRVVRDTSVNDYKGPLSILKEPEDGVA